MDRQGLDLGAPAAILDEPAMQVFKDPSGTLTVTDVLKLPEQAFERHQPRQSYGYHEGTIWLRFEVRNSASDRRMRWLAMGRGLQERIDLHLVDAGGAVQSSVNGSTVPISARDLRSRTVMFALALDPAEKRTVYLALSGRALTLVDLRAWDPVVYADRESERLAMKYLGVGVGMILILAGAMASGARQQPRLMLGAAAYVMLVIYTAILDGFGIALLPASDQLWNQRLAQSAVGLSILFQALFARTFLQIDQRQPWRSRLLGLATMMTGVGAMAPLIGPSPRLGLALIGGAALMLLVVGLMGIARSNIGDRTFVWATAALFTPGLLRALGNAGWIDMPWLTQAALAVGMVIAALILSAGLVLTAREVGRQSRQAQLDLQRQQASENERLREAVLMRTAELDQARQRAERESETKSGFLSTMAHELRSPLHAMLGYAGLLQRQLRGNGREQLALIERHGQRLLQMVDQALTYSRGEAEVIELEPTSVDLQAWLRELVDGRHAATSDAGAAPAPGQTESSTGRVQLAIESPLPPAVEADEQRLGQVLVNLLDNALKYAQHGPVVLRVTDLDVKAARDGAAPSCILRFEVIDQGPGIPEAQQKQAFQAFVRLPAQRHQPGVGLGLTIAASLVARMGGQLRLHSAAGQGCRFAFELNLPVVAPSAGGGTQAALTSTPDPQASRAAAALQVAPPAALLDPLRPMLELGQMIGMARWFEDFADREPAWRDFAHRARDLCLMADLPGLERWVARASLNLHEASPVEATIFAREDAAQPSVPPQPETTPR
jgi:signal transduction histidine kinase